MSGWCSQIGSLTGIVDLLIYYSVFRMMKHHAEFALLVSSVHAAVCPIFQARNILEIVCGLFGTHVSSMYWYVLIYTDLSDSGSFLRLIVQKTQPNAVSSQKNVFGFDSQVRRYGLPGCLLANCVLQITAVVPQLWSLHRGEFTPLKKGAEVQTSAQQHALTDECCWCSWSSAPEYTDEIRAGPGWDSLWPKM